MAREKDEGKRQAILTAAKRLFAEKGFHGVAVSELARETGLPVGSIYTYFENKESVVRTVIDEGWEEFFLVLKESLAAAATPESKLGLILYSVLPGLFKDEDFISLILAEAGRGAGLDEKLERLASLIGEIVLELAQERNISFDFPTRRAMTALSIYFLGSLDTLRLARSAGLSIGADDVVDFIRLSIENAFGIAVEPVGAPIPDYSGRGAGSDAGAGSD